EIVGEPLQVHGMASDRAAYDARVASLLDMVGLLPDMADRYPHEFSAGVRHISHRIAVMYLGRIVEIAPRSDLYAKPLHPYTQALLAAIPIPDPEVEASRPQQILTGKVPSAMRPPPGCRFHTRCPQAMDVCKSVDPPMRDMGGGRAVACHLYDA